MSTSVNGDNQPAPRVLDPQVTVTLENATSPGDVRLVAVTGGKCDLYVGSTQVLSLAVPLNKTHVGLNLVDNTSDLSKPMSTPTKTYVDNKAMTPGPEGPPGPQGPQGNPGAIGPQGPSVVSVNAGNMATLGSDTFIYVPTRTLTAGAGLTGGGDLSANRTFAVGAGTGITVNADDIALTVPIAIVNGGTGAITAVAAKSNLGLANVDNTADTAKPVSTAQQTAIDLKLAKASNLSDVATPATAFNNIKQAATTALTGVVRMALDAEVRQSDAVNAAIVTSNLNTSAALVALVDAAPVAVNWNNGINFSLTVTASRQIDNPTNGKPGQYRTILVQGNDANARTITFGTQFLGDVPTITDCTSTKWYLLTIFCITTTHFLVTSLRAK